MKKSSLLLPIAIMLLAAGCNQSTPTVQKDQPVGADAIASQAATDRELSQLKKSTDQLLAQAKAAKELTYIGPGKTGDGKDIKFYSFTDKYGRKITYGLGSDNIIRETKIENTPKGTVTTNKTATAAVPAGWAIYTNPFGYEIAYPAGWFAADAPQSSVSTLSGYDLAKRTPDYNSGPLALQIYVKDTTMEAELDRLGENKSKIENTILNGYVAKQLAFDTDITSYYLEKNGKIYVLIYSFDQLQGITREESEHVLATFKLK